MNTRLTGFVRNPDNEDFEKQISSEFMITSERFADRMFDKGYTMIEISYILHAELESAIFYSRLKGDDRLNVG